MIDNAIQAHEVQTVFSDDTGVLRRGFKAEDKIRIVLKGLSSGLPVSELCLIEGVPVRLYYQWCLTFLEAGKNGLRGSLSHRERGYGAAA